MGAGCWPNLACKDADMQGDMNIRQARHDARKQILELLTCMSAARRWSALAIPAFALGWTGHSCFPSAAVSPAAQGLNHQACCASTESATSNRQRAGRAGGQPDMSSCAVTRCSAPLSALENHSFLCAEKAVWMLSNSSHVSRNLCMRISAPLTR